MEGAAEASGMRQGRDVGDTHTEAWGKDRLKDVVQEAIEAP